MARTPVPERDAAFLMSITLEICVDSVESALAAEAGGADRIELCRALNEDGLTPSDELIRAVRAAVKLDVFVMIRPRCGDFVYTPAELDLMLKEIERVGGLGADGVVLGALTPAGEVNVDATRRLVAAARPMQVTFHRAFDVTASLERSLEQIIATGADRVLTSGAAREAIKASGRIAQFVQAAQGRICIMAGGGIRPGNVRDLVMAAKVHEVHSSLGFSEHSKNCVWKDGEMPGSPACEPKRFVVREADVRAMREALQAVAAPGGLQTSAH
jgi:copper homeostasis protein